jgi:hypothetical protein
VRFALGSAIATVTVTPPLVGAVSYNADSGTVRSPGGHDVTVATAAVPGVSGARDEIRIAGRPGQ